MKKIIMLVMAITLSLFAYTVELKDIGKVEIPDSICDVKLADSITATYNNYDVGRVITAYVTQVGHAEFDNLGDPIIAMYNFFNMANFKVKLFVAEIPNIDILGVKGFLGVYYPQPDILVINTLYLQKITRLKLFYILAHELAHNVQYEEEQLKIGVANRVVDEIFADLICKNRRKRDNKIKTVGKKSC